MVSKADYLNYMQQNPTRSGYATSPIFQKGFERWDPSGGVFGLGNLLAKATSDVGENSALDFLGGDFMDYGGSNWFNKFVSTDANPEDDPKLWGEQFGHEISHGGWGYKPGFKEKHTREELLTKMHDYMYGDWQPYWPGGYLAKRDETYNPNTGGWTKKGYNTIRNAGLVPWQQGIMEMGPTTATGQVALGQRPDQVKAQGQAYMDPNRGNVQAPTMSQQAMREEATQTGGTVNPHEATRTFSRTSQPVRGPHARGGIASLWQR